MIGTPSLEEIKDISSMKSQEMVFGLGERKSRIFQEVFPDADPEGKLYHTYLYYLPKFKLSISYPRCLCLILTKE